VAGFKLSTEAGVGSCDDVGSEPAISGAITLSLYASSIPGIYRD
jgi:hypothetical protein